METQKFLLPAFGKRAGIALFVLSLLIVVLSKINAFSSIWSGRRLILYAIMCLGLLIFILAKEKTEDEFISRIRLESFCFAIIAGVFFGIAGVAVEHFFPRYGQTTIDILLLQLLGYIFWFQFKIFKAK